MVEFTISKITGFQKSLWKNDQFRAPQPGNTDEAAGRVLAASNGDEEFVETFGEPLKMTMFIEFMCSFSLFFVRKVNLTEWLKGDFFSAM